MKKATSRARATFRLTARPKATFAARSLSSGKDAAIDRRRRSCRRSGDPGGKVKGVIRANRVKLQETARVESALFFEKSLGIEDGASFERVRSAERPNPLAVPGPSRSFGTNGRDHRGDGAANNQRDRN